MHGIIQPIYSLSGFAVGLLVGLTGLGGGSLMTPLLVMVFGMHPSSAVGTDLLFASGTKLAGTATHGWRGSVEWRIVARMTAGSLPAAVAALWFLAHHRNHLDDRHGVTTTVLAIALLATSISILFRRYILAGLADRVARLDHRLISVLTVALGAIIGVMVCLSSVGAGAIGMPALILLYPNVPVARLVGSDIAYAVPLTLVAGLGHGVLGLVDLPLLASLLIGSVPGVIIGGLLSSRSPDRVLRIILAATLALVGGKLLT